MTAWEKAAFRRSARWKNFCFGIKAERKVCEFCNRGGKLHVHHRILTKNKFEYEDLNPRLFAVLCSVCHRFVHAKHKHLMNFERFYGFIEGSV